MASESTSQTQPKQLTCASNVHLEVEDGNINFNNGIALLESQNTSYHSMLQFLKNSCISVALTKQPSAYYSKLLQEFWYTAKADNEMKTITFTLLCFDKPLSFDLYVFSTIIGLRPSENCVSVPPKETEKADAYKNNDLKSLKCHNTTATTFKPTLENEVPLTAYMCKVSKLSPDLIKSLVPPSREVNVDDTTDKSLSETSVQHVT
ncbi:hypothetical protein Tco_1249014 [Tanacetum coccineum]